MATCTVTIVPPPPPPPVEHKVVLELDAFEAQVLYAILSQVRANGRLEEVSYKIFHTLYKANLPGSPVPRPSINGKYLTVPE